MEERFDFSVNIDFDNNQDSKFDENELDKIIIEAKPAVQKKYKRSTSWGIVKFKKWKLKRNILVDTGTAAPQKLNDILRKS